MPRSLFASSDCNGPIVTDAKGIAPIGGREHPSLSVAERERVRDFNNLDREGTRLFSELVGTYLLVVVAAGASVVNVISHGGVGRIASVTAPGLMVLAIILFMGTASGAHLNPVVTVAFALRGDFQWRRVPGYVLAQLVGATLASLTLLFILGKHGDSGATIPGSGASDLQALAIEALLTLGLVSTVLGAASGAQNIGAFSAVAAGAYVTLAGLWASPISGASMNPARTLGPDLVRGDFTHTWVYVVGPLVGTVVAVGIAYLLRGPGDSSRQRKAGRQHAPS